MYILYVRTQTQIHFNRYMNINFHFKITFHVLNYYQISIAILVIII